MLNNITIIGRLVADPELKHTQNNIPFTSFRIACDRDYKNADGERDTDFINCTAWRAIAQNVANYFSKGRMISINGRLQNNNWIDRDGNKHYNSEILVNSVYFVDSKKAADKPANSVDDSAAYDYAYDGADIF